jgi:hypothetical protein
VPSFKLPTINTASRYSARVLYGLPDEDLRVFSTAFSMRMRVMLFLRVTSVRRIALAARETFRASPLRYLSVASLFGWPSFSYLCEQRAVDGLRPHRGYSSSKG